MPYPAAIKELAYKLDPECWKSYSGLAPSWKRVMDGRRSTSLGTATHKIIGDIMSSPKPTEHPMAKEPFLAIPELLFLLAEPFGAQPSFRDIGTEPEPRKPPKPRRNPPMKIGMLMHFYGACQAFAPEEQRTSRAYTQFVKELLHDGLIERPTKAEREECPGWAYKTTAKGAALVNAICSVPNPVERTRWVMPT